MKDPENLLEFLALFGKAIGITGFESMCGVVNREFCDKCDAFSALRGPDCIRWSIREITRNYKPQSSKKYRIVKTTSDDRCIKHTCVLPGLFDMKQAEDIVKAYNSKEYKFEEAE